MRRTAPRGESAGRLAGSGPHIHAFRATTVGEEQGKGTMRAADRLFSKREHALGALPGKNSRLEEACGMTMAVQVPLPLQRLVAGRGRGGPIDSRRLGSRDGGMGGGVPVSGPLTRLSALETGTKPWSCDDWLQAVVSGAEELPKEDATQSPSGKEGVHSNHRRPISSRRGFTPQRVLAAGWNS